MTSDDRVWWEQVYSVAQRVRGRGGEVYLLSQPYHYQIKPQECHSPTIIGLNPRNAGELGWEQVKEV